MNRRGFLRRLAAAPVCLVSVPAFVLPASPKLLEEVTGWMRAADGTIWRWDTTTGDVYRPDFHTPTLPAAFRITIEYALPVDGEIQTIEIKGFVAV